MVEQFSKLFEPGRIGKLEIKNRIYMAPMVSGTAEDGYATPRMIDYFVARAQGGVGIISCQSSSILYESRAPRRLYVFDDKFIPRLQQLTKAVHDNGAKVVLEMCHWGMLSANHRSVPDPDAIKVIAPSPISYLPGGYIAKEATQEDIDRIVAGFSEGARRIKDAGFDAVEIHGAHGRLIGQFFSPMWNHRQDKYGGSLENRARFACKVISAIRNKVGPDFPVIFRMNGSDFMEGSATLEDSVRSAPMYVAAGADALHISASTPGSYHWQFPCFLFPDGNLVHTAEAIRKAVNVPIITVGKIGDPVFADKIIRDGKADFIAMGRALLADPDLPNKAREGRTDDIRRCLYCNNCLRHGEEELVRNHLRCTVNPFLAREAEAALKPAATRKKVVVIGGGVGGMEAARVLAQRGHDVRLYEKDSKLGGQWLTAAAPARDPSGNFKRLLRQMEQGLRSSGAQVVQGKAVTVEMVREIKPDAVVVATGATPRKPDVPGVNGSNVVLARDILLGTAHTGKRVVVVGGSETGLEVADYLAKQGKRVIVVEQDELGKGVQHDIFQTLRDSIVAQGIQFFVHSPLLAVGERGAFIAFQKDRLFLEADTVVLSVGVEKMDNLSDELKKFVPEVYIIGDAVNPRDAREAIQEGADTGRQI